MKRNDPPTIIRWTLTAGLLFAATGCDDGTPYSPGEIDRHAAEATLAERGDDPTPLTPAELDALVIEEPTVRDVVEGRVDAPKISSRFGVVDEDGEVVEECSQRKAALAGEPVEAPLDLPFDASNERLLATPLAETCVLADRRTESMELVRCGDYEGPNARVTLDADFDLVSLGDPTGEYNCYMCVDTGLCGWGGKAKKLGHVLFGYCVSVGWHGCC